MSNYCYSKFESTISTLDSITLRFYLGVFSKADNFDAFYSM